MKPKGYLPHSQVPFPILNQLDPVHASQPTSWRFILILSSHLRLALIVQVLSIPQFPPPKHCINLSLYPITSNIQGYQKVSAHLMITLQKVTSNIQSVPRQSPDIYWQGHGDTRLLLTPSVIPNSNSIIMVGDWNCLKYCIFACFCTVIVSCTETLWSPCIKVQLFHLLKTDPFNWKNSPKLKGVFH
jgi:hypothetical protein